MPDLKFACPHCRQHLEAPAEMFGTDIACPSCNKGIQVPWPDAVPKQSELPLPSPVRGAGTSVGHRQQKSEGASNRLTKGFFLWSIALGLGIADVLKTVAGIAARIGASDVLGLQGLAFIPMLYGAIVMLVLYHRMWGSIQDGHARTTPGKAVGMLFVPFYNVYWAFQVVWGFSKDYNAYIERHGTEAAPLPERLFLANVVMSFLTWIPVVGYFILLANYLITLVIVWKICDAVNAIGTIEAPAPAPQETALPQVASSPSGTVSEDTQPEFTCPHCNKTFQAAEGLRGTEIPCPLCNVSVRLPLDPGRFGGEVEVFWLIGIGVLSFVAFIVSRVASLPTVLIYGTGAIACVFALPLGLTAMAWVLSGLLQVFTPGGGTAIPLFQWKCRVDGLSDAEVRVFRAKPCMHRFAMVYVWLAVNSLVGAAVTLVAFGGLYALMEYARQGRH